MSNDKKDSPVGSSGWFGHLQSVLNVTSHRWAILLKYYRRRIGIRCLILFNQCRILRNNCLILCHKALYRFYLCTKRKGLPIHRIYMRRRLLNTERKFVSKYGCDWRLRVFDDEIVQFLKFSKYIHGVLWPNS